MNPFSLIIWAWGMIGVLAFVFGWSFVYPANPTPVYVVCAIVAAGGFGLMVKSTIELIRLHRKMKRDERNRHGYGREL